MPIYNWIMCHEEATALYVLKDYEGKKTNDELNIVFEKIYNQFFDKYGFTSEFKEYLNAKKRVLLKKLDAYIKDDRSLLTFVKIEEAEIKAKYESGLKDADYWGMVASLETALGFQIDTKKMSVDSFYNHLKIQVEKNKQLAKWQKK